MSVPLAAGSAPRVRPRWLTGSLRAGAPDPLLRPPPPPPPPQTRPAAGTTCALSRLRLVPGCGNSSVWLRCRPLFHSGHVI